MKNIISTILSSPLLRKWSEPEADEKVDTKKSPEKDYDCQLLVGESPGVKFSTICQVIDTP